MNKFPFLYFVLIFTLASSTAMATAVEFNDIGSYVAEQSKRFRIPDLEILVLDSTSSKWSTSFGKQTHPDQQHYIGSISKSLTAFGLLRLVDAGKVDLDQAVTDILPQLEFSHYGEQITIRTLLHHTSGISKKHGFRNMPSYSELNQRKYKVDISREPGTKHEYSNLNYSILGWVITSVSGLPFADYMRKEVFEPLQMENTSASVMTGDQVIDQYQYWFGFPMKARSGDFNASAIPPGFIRSTTSDIGNYIRVNLDNGVYKGEQLLSEDLLKIMHTSWNGQDYGYAMGWKRGSFNDHSMLQHLGSTATSYGGLFLLPEEKTGFVLLTNSNSLTYTEGILKGILQILTDGEPEAAPIRELYVRIGAGMLCLILLFWYGRKIYFIYKEEKRFEWMKSTRDLVFHLSIAIAIVILFPRFTDIPFFKFVRVLPDFGIAAILLFTLPVYFNIFKLVRRT